MAEITAKAVQELRAKTGVGMMECKKALTESNGDMEEAVKLLREKGLAVAAKKMDRIAADGIVDILYDEASGKSIMIEINTETDFVAKNEDFRKFVKSCLETIMETNPSDVEDFLTKKFVGSDMDVATALQERILVIGEKLSIRRFCIIEGIQSTYIHGKGSIGVIVRFDADASLKGNDELKEVMKNIALQVAAMNPAYLSKEDVPADVITSEKDILLSQIKNDPENSKKPANIIERMVEGRIKKFFDTNCLLEQGYVKDDGMKVADYIDSYVKSSGNNVSIAEYVRYEKGEGIQKREENFAEEIAKLTQG